MTGLLNYLIYIVLIAGAFWTYKAYTAKKPTKSIALRAVLTLVLVFVTNVVTTMYVPRVGPSKPPVETFTVVPESDGGPQIQDRVRKPEKTVEESKKATAELVDWRAAKAAREKKNEVPPTE